MSACEKCWADAGGNTYIYQRLIGERDRNPCTPEESAGPNAKQCQTCGRNTLHQHTNEPMCGCAHTRESP